ncbi:MAG: SAM-dependent methyltransferase [Rhodospirillales bacterium]|nr:SAM-dependent methyltransferase [Rhodospirillales bacterium]
MDNAGGKQPPHTRPNGPSPWVARFAGLARKGSRVLDLACGGGRNGRLFLARGHPLTLVDRDVGHVQDLKRETGVEIIEADLESGSPAFEGNGSFAGRRFGAIVVVNYLHRPLLVPIVEAIEAGGLLIYETFARGNEAFSRPKNPDFLLRSGELLELVRGRMQVVAYEHGLIADDGCSGVKQRIAAVKDTGGAARPDGEPPPHPLHPD